MAIDSGSVSFATKMAVANTAANMASAGTANELAMLQRQLKAVMKQASDLARDSSIPDDVKKEMQQLLQNQIQLIQQRIAQLQSEGKRAAAPTDDEQPKNATSKTAAATKTDYSSAPAVPSGVNTFA